MPNTTRFDVNVLQPVQGSPVAKATVRLPALADWAKGTVLGFVTGTGSAVNEVQTITVTSTPSGTFRLQWTGPVQNYQTGAITYSGTAATMVANIQAALDTLFGAGNTLVAGTSPYTIAFQGELAGKSIPLPTIISSLSGGSLAAMRRAAIRNYAKGEGKTERHVGGAFTNPDAAVRREAIDLTKRGIDAARAMGRCRRWRRCGGRWRRPPANR